MLKSLKSQFLAPVDRIWRRVPPICLFIILFAAISLIPQENAYWKNAAVGKSKIFSISFIDKQIGVANSADGEVLVTSDGGLNWKAESVASSGIQSNRAEIYWKADVFCAIMKTTDGGNSWIPYDDGKQEHFCGVYLKDENTGYKVASEFLNKVTMEVNYYYMTDKLDSLLNHPHQCTEYYKNPKEGWALGWCVSNFNK
ncbi:MAG: hypothetical protein IPM14_06245 [bacterium]|nr:hypothetical protein [bacterium]